MLEMVRHSARAVMRREYDGEYERMEVGCGHGRGTEEASFDAQSLRVLAEECHHHRRRRRRRPH